MAPTDTDAEMIRVLAARERKCPSPYHWGPTCMDCIGGKVPLLPVLRRDCGFVTSPRDSSHPTNCSHCGARGWLPDLGADTGDIIDALLEAGYDVDLKSRRAEREMWARLGSYEPASAPTTRTAILEAAVKATEAGS